MKFDATNAATCHFHIGLATSLGIVSISISIEDIRLSFDENDADTPILLSIYVMDKLGIYSNHHKNILVHPESSSKDLIARICGNTFVQRSRHLSFYFKKAMLSKTHHLFGHPLTD